MQTSTSSSHHAHEVRRSDWLLHGCVPLPGTWAMLGTQYVLNKSVLKKVNEGKLLFRDNITQWFGAGLWRQPDGPLPHQVTSGARR